MAFVHHMRGHILTSCFAVQVPAGHVWLQGDNTLNSTDSRHYGPVPYALVRGRAFLKVGAGCKLPPTATAVMRPYLAYNVCYVQVWPPHEAGWIRSYVPQPYAGSPARGFK